jgi:alanine racemase
MQNLEHTKKAISAPLEQQLNSYASWVEIDAKAFEHNIKSYKSITPHAEFAPVIKSNAYGHGIELIAQLCENLAEVALICVVSLSEAVYLRTQKITKPILVLSIVDQDLEQAVLFDISIVIFSYNIAHKLSEVAQKYNKRASVHIKIDTGLSRLGIVVDQALSVIQDISKLPGIHLQGIFSHFADSESSDQSFTQYQLSRFNALNNKLKSHDIHIPLQHITCSAAITAQKNYQGTIVRAGIGIYGLWPSHENKQLTRTYYPTFNLQPVLTWKTKIIQIKDIPSGSYVGYSRTFQVHQTARIAILPIGYYDGYDRQLSNRGHVLINNKLAPIIGRIAMNMTIVDITSIPDVHEDTIVTLLGDQSGITAEDIARSCDTINYEIVARINPLLPRILV